MQIAFVSSLTAEDEILFARSFMTAIGSVLDVLPIAYSIRITTSSGAEFDRTRGPSGDAQEPPRVLPRQAGASVVPFAPSKPPTSL